MKPSNRGSWLPRGRHLVIAFPYAWMLLFFLIPFLIILKISLAETQVAIPPYTSLVEYAEEKLRQKQSIQEYYRTQASLSRAMNRLKVSKRKKW